MTSKTNQDLITRIEEKLKTVYDPEFPMVDIFTLGLIYGIELQEQNKQVRITMTFTTAACPMADLLQELVKNAVMEIIPDYTLDLIVTFDPMRTFDMIKDDDLKRMFE